MSHTNLHLQIFLGLKMNKTRQFIEVFVRRGPHKISGQYGVWKNIGASWTT
jgi:hypothetical protein